MLIEDKYISCEALRRYFIEKGFYPVFVREALRKAPAVEVVRSNCSDKMPECIRRLDVMNICERYIQQCFDSNDSKGQALVEKIFDEIVGVPTANVGAPPIHKTYESLVHGASFAFGGKCGEDCVFGEIIEKGGAE